MVSCSGTLGNVVYANDTFHNRLATHDLIRVVPNNKDIPEGYLFAYLSSKYGYTLLTQSGFGGVVKHINPEHIRNIPIPIFPNEKQQEIHDLVIEATNLKVEANRLFEEAKEIFEKEIGKSKFEHTYQTNKIQSKEIRNNFLRLDAKYQIGQKILNEERVIHLEYIPIRNFASDIYVGNRSKRNYVAQGVPSLSSSDMLLFNPKRYAKQISPNSRNLESLLARKGDILISRSGTVGNTVLIRDDLDNCAVSEHALRLVINKERIAPEYVFCYLNTKHGKSSLEIAAYGSVIITLNEEYVSNIGLPILPEEKQKQIVDKIATYVAYMDKATLLETQAIHLVENEIESWEK